MCTLIVLWKVHPAAPLVIAQCRDEMLDRPALDVARWRTRAGVEVVSGRDALAGGTWFGVGPRVVCGLTNRRDERGPRRGALSRGDIVVDALECRDVDEVERRLSALEGPAYGPFSLLAVDDDAMLYADNGGAGDTLRFSRHAPGVHVLGNRGLDNPADPVVQNTSDAARALLGAGEDALVDGLQEILARHGEGWPCVHLPAAAPVYGTRSAGVLVRRAVEPRFFTTPGAPCATSWRDSTALLATPREEAR